MKYITHSCVLRFFNGKTFDFNPYNIGILLVHKELIILLIENYQEGKDNLVCIHSIEQRKVWEVGAEKGFLRYVDFSTYPNCIVAFSSVNVNYVIDIETGKVLNTFNEIGK